LMGVAKRVDQKARSYDNQLASCRDKFDSGSWWNPFS